MESRRKEEETLFFLTPFLKNYYLFIWLPRVLVAHLGASVLVVARGIQFTHQGSHSGPLHWKQGVLATEPQGKSHYTFFQTPVTVAAFGAPSTIVKPLSQRSQPHSATSAILLPGASWPCSSPAPKVAAYLLHSQVLVIPLSFCTAGLQVVSCVYSPHCSLSDVPTPVKFIHSVKYPLVEIPCIICFPDYLLTDAVCNALNAFHLHHKCEFSPK